MLIKFLKSFYLWGPLVAMISVEHELAEIKKIPIAVDVATGQMIPIDENSKTPSLINVTMKIVKPESILDY